jgi:flagellar assembly protein FliH
MSSRARLVSNAGSSQVVPFSWGGAQPVRRVADVAPLSPMMEEAAPAPNAQQLANIEREAFAKGYEQGERSGLEAAGKRGEAMLRRLSETLAELTSLRASMIRQTETQIVELALAVARRIVLREVTLDRNLLIAIVRVALDRLGESARVTVRLHPEEYEATGAARVAEFAGNDITFIPDARVGRGGCRVESDMGMLDAGVEAQIQEIARALLGEDQGAHVAHGR